MAMELSDRLTNDEIEELEGLYVASFPPEERRAWSDIVEFARCGTISLYGIRHCGHIAGMVTVWHLDGVDYVEHFAVDPAERGNGLGGRVIEDIVVRAGDRPVVLEVERPGSNDMAARRIGFYSRHGFRAIEDFDYVQPPYGEGLPWVPLMLMSSGDVDPEAVARELYVTVYGCDSAPCVSD